MFTKDTFICRYGILGKTYRKKKCAQRLYVVRFSVQSFISKVSAVRKLLLREASKKFFVLVALHHLIIITITILTN